MLNETFPSFVSMFVPYCVPSMCITSMFRIVFVLFCFVQMCLFGCHFTDNNHMKTCGIVMTRNQYSVSHQCHLSTSTHANKATNKQIAIEFSNIYLCQSWKYCGCHMGLNQMWCLKTRWQKSLKPTTQHGRSLIVPPFPLCVLSPFITSEYFKQWMVFLTTCYPFFSISVVYEPMFGGIWTVRKSLPFHNRCKKSLLLDVMCMYVARSFLFVFRAFSSNAFNSFHFKF